MGFDVRLASPEEFAAVGEITAAGYLADDLLALADGRTDPYESKLLDAAGRAAAADLLVAADPDGTLLGTVTWCPPDSTMRELAQRPEQGEFRMLSVAVAARRRGVARALVAACIDRAIALGMTEMVISSLPIMTKAHELYFTFGFERAPELDWNPFEMVHLWGFRLHLSPGPAPTSPTLPASTEAAGSDARPPG